MSTVSLTMIVKDEFDKVANIVSSAVNYVDEIILVVSDRKTATALQEVAKIMRNPPVVVKYRKWNDHFDDARNVAQSMVTSDYWFWIDADDKFNFKALPKIVETADLGGYDEILLPYNYAQDEDGNCVAYHWRERLMRTSHPFTWKGWVHETPISDLPFKAHKVNVEVFHENSDDHVQESLKRNHKILLAATAASNDPRYQMYLGTSYMSLGNYVESINILSKFVKVSGNTEDVYRSLCVMSEAAMKLKNLDLATQYAMQAVAQIPSYPNAYRLLAQWEASEQNWDEALEWAKMSYSKPVPDGMGVFDPSSRNDVILLAAQSSFMKKKTNAALKWLRLLPEDHPARVEMEDDMVNEADAETFINMLPKLKKYFKDEESLFNSLTFDMKYDVRLRGLRDIVETPKIWSDKSIVFLIGEGYEEWGPHTLDQGMGGSEEAVIYLSRELVKLGWEVTIYGAVDKRVHDGPEGVYAPNYLPWRLINKSDTFNIFVAWRAPEFTEYINAKVKIADVHDVLNKSTVKPYPDVTYFVKSQFHRDLYLDLPDEKFRIIGNGIVKDQFK